MYCVCILQYQNENNPFYNDVALNEKRFTSNKDLARSCLSSDLFQCTDADLYFCVSHSWPVAFYSESRNELFKKNIYCIRYSHFPMGHTCDYSFVLYFWGGFST